MLQYRLRLSIIAFGIVAATQLLFAGTNYYVSPTGSNANNGLSDLAPFQTIQFGLDHCQPGDTLNAMLGVYQENVTVHNGGSSALGNIVLRAAPAQVPTLDGSLAADSSALIRLENISYFQIMGFKFQNQSGVHRSYIELWGINNHILISGCNFFDADSIETAAILAHGGGDEVVVLNNGFSEINGLNAHPIAFYGDDANTPFTNTVIDGNTVVSCDVSPSECITVSGNVDTFTISNNYLHQNNNIGIVMAGGYAWLGIPANINHARNGICSKNVVVESNSPTGFAAGIYCDGCQDVTIEYNNVVGCDVGIEVGCEQLGFIAERVVVKNNLIHANLQSGLGFGGYNYPDTSGYVRNCLFRNNTVYDNDLLQSGFGQLWITYAANCTVQSNIFATITSNTMVNGYEAVPGIGLVCDSNLYYRYGGGVANTTNHWNHADYTSFSAFQAASGLDAHSITQDPQFMSITPGLSNLNLQATSPARNAGNLSIAAAPGETDFDGATRVQEGRIDMGAYEFTDPDRLEADVLTAGPSVSLWPNPTVGVLHVQVSSKRSGPIALRLVSMHGKVVWEGMGRLVGGEFEWDAEMRSLESGVYFLEVMQEAGVGTVEKVMVER